MREVNTVASKFAWVTGKQGFLVVIALLASLVAAKGGFSVCYNPVGFFDGG
jgi:hypothetical protein